MRGLTRTLLIAASGLALTATAASAAIVCNEEGDCWHVRDRYEFRPEWGLTVHPDEWRWSDHERRRYRWREHEGRGYWRGGRWIEIPG
jgi:hypothetical protein